MNIYRHPSRQFEILTPESHEPIPAVVNGSFFVGIFYPLSKTGCGVLMRSAGFNPTLLEEAVARAADLLRQGEAPAEIKVVCPPALVSRIRQTVQGLGQRLVTCLERQQPETSLFFFTETGRIRVQRETTAPTNLAPPARKARVLIVDDSATIRKLLTSIFSARPDFEVVGVAERPSQVEPMINELSPDVITLDIHMPEMNGVDLLRRIQPKYRIPTVMITSVSKEEGPMVLNALEAGAVDYIQKPTLQELPVVAEQIAEKVAIAAQSRRLARASAQNRPLLTWDPQLRLDTRRIIAIGSSTGGTEALRDILINMPANIPPIVIVQHIPPVFSAALAKRLHDLCPFEVKEAEAGDVLKPGRVLIAPGGKHMRVERHGTEYRVAISDEDPVNRHKPSVDVLFDSVATQVGKSAIGMILTGMGTDGARGLLQMKTAGSETLAQDEASCVVFGMPKEAIRLSAATQVVSLGNLPKALVSLLKI